MNVTLEYFAQLRDLAGRAREQRTVETMTLGDLYERVKSDYHFPLEQDHVRVALNDSLAEWEDVPQEGDVVVFLPPVTGG